MGNNNVFMSILLIALILIGGCLEGKTPSGIANKPAFKGICPQNLPIYQSTGFLVENQSIEFVGVYAKDSWELIGYEPHPCLQWMGAWQCSILYTEKNREGISSLRRASCPGYVEGRFPEDGGYRVDRSCCLNNGNCSLIKGSYLEDELCSVIVEDPKTERACYTSPIKLDRPLEGVDDRKYVRVRGYLTPSHRTQPVELEEQKKQHFILEVDSHSELPITVNSSEAGGICRENLMQNMESLREYCSENNFSCKIEQPLDNPLIAGLSPEVKWVVAIPLGSKQLSDRDLQLQLNMFCTIDPYSGDIIDSTVCSVGGCVICEP